MRVENRLRFVGSVENIASVYACADVFAMPSYYEAFSLATLEAAAAGLPLIVTRVNGTEDLVVDRWNGFFVERSPECVAEALDRVIEDPSLLSALSRQARDSALPYAWPSIVQRTLAVYDEYCGATR